MKLLFYTYIIENSQALKLHNNKKDKIIDKIEYDLNLVTYEFYLNSIVILIHLIS